jgi:hypothetical protein
MEEVMGGRTGSKLTGPGPRPILSIFIRPTKAENGSVPEYVPNVDLPDDSNNFLLSGLPTELKVTE